MDLAARRPHISAGIALASAAVIAAGPMTQHLPKFDVAQHLPEVSVSEINLTDASESMMDLFSSVESQLASLASGAPAAAVPAAALTDFLNPAMLPLPAATWVNLFQNAGANLQTDVGLWQADPFPIGQQMLANWAQYGIDYITPYKTAATGAVSLLKANKNGTPGLFFKSLHNAWSMYLTGNIRGAEQQLYLALVQNPLSSVALPLEQTLKFLPQIPQNFTNLVNGMVGSSVDYTSSLTTVGLVGLGVLAQPFGALSTGLQHVSDAYNAGNLPAMLGYAVDIPGEIANSVINGTVNASGSHYGLLTPQDGLLTTFTNVIPQTLAKQIVSPNAQNLSTGGSLAVSGQQLVNALTTGWPDWTPAINAVSGELTAWLQQIPSVVSNLPTILGGALGSLAAHIGLIVANLLKLL
ncbi:hypothetical protein H7K38_14475 [Mycobacterium alsense]|uniref:PE-PGRS family protein n=1 Tax=Mycobacterium alsense TaxID=324058 RepID=A0AA41XPZ1_9MYCO|nr:hypothetical protein [Mycobacterium alsense]MCV7379852.1 hypothetical protein [Mycobacterium alsense]